jgi:hypothetical protein
MKAGALRHFPTVSFKDNKYQYLLSCVKGPSTIIKQMIVEGVCQQHHHLYSLSGHSRTNNSGKEGGFLVDRQEWKDWKRTLFPNKK